MGKRRKQKRHKRRRTSVMMTLKGSEVLEKIPRLGGNSGRVYVPKSWIGKKVKVVLLDE
ncbi:MAG: DUF2080 family transposase-associated protein [DPANN group archaeon]|nr:DUF2080 family transposase-associated protein [DPANN group archaeon]